MRIATVVLVAVFSCVPLSLCAQNSVGTIVVQGNRVKPAGQDRSALLRKRFYVFSGGLKENQALIDRIKTADVPSRNCFYSQLQASPCFIKWLEAENCESPFCRAVRQEDIRSVKEFEDAYQKGLALYAHKPDIALRWLIDNLPTGLTSGFYDKKRSLLGQILGDVKPVQSIMSTSTAAEATFVDILVNGPSTRYLVSNLLPIEIGSKSYVWACEISVQAGKTVKLPMTLTPDPKKCSIAIRELNICTTGACEKK